MKVKIIGSAFMLILVLIFLSWHTLSTYYYYYFEYQHFSRGDKIFMKKINPINNQPIFVIGMYKMVKQIEEKEIDTMQVDDQTKAVLKLTVSEQKHFDPYLVVADSDLIISEKSRQIGIYLDCEKVNFKDYHDKLSQQFFYIIKPDVIKIQRDLNQTNSKLPIGYIYANPNYYVFPYLLTNK